MAYTTYATKADLAAFLFVDVNTLNTNHERLLQRASELIDQSMFKNYDKTDADHVEAAKYATCAQVEFWLQEGEDKGIASDVASYSLDSLSVQYTDKALGQQLSKRAVNFLSKVGLLYRGVG